MELVDLLFTQTQGKLRRETKKLFTHHFLTFCFYLYFCLFFSYNPWFLSWSWHSLHKSLRVNIAILFLNFPSVLRHNLSSWQITYLHLISTSFLVILQLFPICLLCFTYSIRLKLILMSKRQIWLHWASHFLCHYLVISKNGFL